MNSKTKTDCERYFQSKNCVFLNAYLDIRSVSLAVAPSHGHRSEQPVGIVEFATLQVQKQGRVRLLLKEIRQFIILNQHAIFHCNCVVQQQKKKSQLTSRKSQFKAKADVE